MTRSYLDHASTSPLRPAALAAMTEWLERSSRGEVGDPSRSHHEGLVARQAVEDARDRVAAALGARAREVVFCSGATEAIGAASLGATARGGAAGRRRIVLGGVEHSAVRSSAARDAASHDAEVMVLGVDRTGRVDPGELAAAVDEHTAVVHLQWGNHEVGTTQPLDEAVAACRDAGALLHVDAAQAAGRVPVAFTATGTDLLSVSAHKFGGPPGIGALVVRRGLRLDPFLLGGDQERARRAGMENLPAIAGMAAALDEATGAMAAETAAAARHLARITDWAASADGVELLGHPTERLPHLVCLAVEGVEPQPVLIGLDRAGVSVHSGNSCSSEAALEPSPVLAAMGVDAHRSLRISVGWSTTEADVDRLLVELPRVLDGLRSLRT